MKQIGLTDKQLARSDRQLHAIAILTLLLAGLIVMIMAHLITFIMIPRNAASSLDMLSKEHANYSRWDDDFVPPALAAGIEYIIAQDYTAAQFPQTIAFGTIQLERVPNSIDVPTPTSTNMALPLIGLVVTPTPTVLQLTVTQAAPAQAETVQAPILQPVAQATPVVVAIAVMPTSQFIMPTIAEPNHLPIESPIVSEPSAVPTPFNPESVPTIPTNIPLPQTAKPSNNTQPTTTNPAQSTTIPTSAPSPTVVVPTNLPSPEPATATNVPIITTLPLPTNSPTVINIPTTIPTATNVSTTIPTATSVPTNAPTATIVQPTLTSAPTATTVPTATSVPTNTPTATSVATSTPIPTIESSLMPSQTPEPTLTPTRQPIGPDAYLEVSPNSGPTNTAVIYTFTIKNNDIEPMHITDFMHNLSSISSFAGESCTAPDGGLCYNQDASTAGYWVWSGDFILQPNASTVFTVQGTYVALNPPPPGGQIFTSPSVMFYYTLQDTLAGVELRDNAPFVLIP